MTHPCSCTLIDELLAYITYFLRLVDGFGAFYLIRYHVLKSDLAALKDDFSSHRTSICSKDDSVTVEQREQRKLINCHCMSFGHAQATAC